MGKNRQQLLEILSLMSNDDLALVLATGLNCDKCPVMPSCYDKVVCNKNIFAFLEKE